MINPPPLVAIVDDDESIRKAVTRLVLSAGLRAAAFASGPQFLATIQTQRPDCLVLDVQMPEMNGLDIQTQIAATGARLPIIFITGYEDPTAEARALGAGAVAFILKPFSNHSLLEAVHAVVGRQGGE